MDEEKQKQIRDLFALYRDGFESGKLVYSSALLFPSGADPYTESVTYYGSPNIWRPKSGESNE